MFYILMEAILIFDFKMKKLISDTRLVLDQIIGTIGNRPRLNQCKMIRILMIDRKFKKIHYKTLLVRIQAFLHKTQTSI